MCLVHARPPTGRSHGDPLYISADANAPTPALNLAELHHRFLTALLPRVEGYARVYFRHTLCGDRRRDQVAEAVGLAWQWFARLAERGGDATRFPMALASFACRAVKSGRRVCGRERAGDAMRRTAHPCHGVNGGTLRGTPVEEALRDNTRTGVPEQVAFRVDFAAWLAGLADRDRRIVFEMTQGERTRDLARRLRRQPLARFAEAARVPPRLGRISG